MSKPILEADLYQEIKELQQQVRDLGIALNARPKEETESIAPTFLGTWANYEAAGTFKVVTYRKSTDGKVSLSGLAKNAAEVTNLKPMFTLPEGFRPVKQELFTCWGESAGGGIGAKRIDVKSNGEVIWESGAVASVPYISLGTISFYTT